MSAQLSPRQVWRRKNNVFQAAKHGETDRIMHLLLGLSPDLIEEILHHESVRGHEKGTPLTIAAELGHLGVVQLLVERFNVQCDQKTVSSKVFTYGVTALMCAAFCGHLDIVKFLVNHGSDFSLKTVSKETPLYYACRRNHLDVIKYLVERGAQIDDVSASGRSCLLAACISGSEQTVQYLLDKGANVNGKNHVDTTPLHMAVILNSPQLVELLLKNGASFSKDTLITAARSLSLDVVRFFVESSFVTRKDKIDALELLGARVATTDMDEGFRYLRQAMVERHKDPADIISKPHSPLPTLSDAVESRTLEELEARQSDPYILHLECLAIVQRTLGCNIGSVWDDFHAYFLKLKSVGQHSEALDILLHAVKTVQLRKRGHLPSYLSYFLSVLGDMLQNGQSPLFTTVLEVLELALTDMRQISPAFQQLPVWNDKLVNACIQCIMVGLKVAQGQEEGRLLKEKAECLIRLQPHLSHGRSVLHQAVVIYWEKAWELKSVKDERFDLLVSFLIQCGADVNVMDHRRNRPLHDNCRLSLLDDASEMQCRIVRTLVEAGALVGVQNSQGKTPLDVAGTEAVTAILREHFPVSLKSLAATAVVKHQIPYAGEIPRDLEEFVQYH